MLLNQSIKKIFSLHLDSVGFSASLLCSIHCAVVPVLLSMSAWTGLQVLDDPSVEYVVLCLSVLIALTSIVPCYFRHHHRWGAMLIMIAGFALIAAGRGPWSEGVEVALTSTGAAVVSMAHWYNQRLCRNHACKIKKGS